MVNITYGSIGVATAGWYNRRLLRHATPDLILERFAQRRTLPRNNTQIIQFRRSNPIPPATTPLAEGVTPEPGDFSYETVSAQIQQYGAYVEITDVVQDTSKDMVLRDVSERQGEQIAETKERLMWSVLLAGSQVFRGAGVNLARTALTTTDPISVGNIRRVVTSLHRNKARKLKTILSASENYSTFPVEAAYCAITHTDLVPTLRDLVPGGNPARESRGFIPVAQYGARRGVTSQYEIGSFEETRFLATPDHGGWRGAGASIADATAANWHTTDVGNAGHESMDVYPVLFLGRDAFGTVVLRGKGSVIPMVLNPGTPRSGDPLGQRGSIGWKMWHCCMILNQLWMHRLEVTVAV